MPFLGWNVKDFFRFLWSKAGGEQEAEFSRQNTGVRSRKTIDA